MKPEYLASSQVSRFAIIIYDTVVLGVAVDAADNIYIADGGHDRIRKVTPHLFGAGVLSIGPIPNGPPGAVARIPVSAVFPTGVSVNSLSFGIQFAIGNGAPAPPESIVFEKDANLPLPTISDSGGSLI